MTEPLTAEQRAAVGWADRHGHRPTPATCSTTTGSPTTGGSSGAATTPSTTSAAAPTTGSSATRRRSCRLAEHFFRPPSRSWRGCGSPTPGAASSTPARGSARSGAPRTAARSAYAAGYTGLGVGATRFGAQVLLDLLDGRRHRADRAGDGAPQAGAVPAGAAALGRHRADPPRGREGRRATAAGAARGCAPWTRSAWASTHDARRPEESDDQVRRHVRPGRHLPRRGALRPRRPGVVRRRRRGGRRRAVRRRHLAPAGHPVRAAGDPVDRLPRRTTGPGRTSRCASTRCATCGCSTPATSRCRPATSSGRCAALTEAVADGRHERRDPGGPRRRPLDHPGRRHRRGPPARRRPGVGDALRRARRHRRHRVRLALRPRPADAAADRVRRGARRPVPADRAARLLARRRRRWTGWPSRGCGPSR